MVHRLVGLVTDVFSATENADYTACAALRVPDVAALVFSAIGQNNFGECFHLCNVDAITSVYWQHVKQQEASMIF